MFKIKRAKIQQSMDSQDLVQNIRPITEEIS